MTDFLRQPSPLEDVESFASNGAIIDNCKHSTERGIEPPLVIWQQIREGSLKAEPWQEEWFKFLYSCLEPRGGQGRPGRAWLLVLLNP